MIKYLIKKLVNKRYNKKTNRTTKQSLANQSLLTSKLPIGTNTSSFSFTTDKDKINEFMKLQKIQQEQRDKEEKEQKDKEVKQKVDPIVVNLFRAEDPNNDIKNKIASFM